MTVLTAFRDGARVTADHPRLIAAGIATVGCAELASVLGGLGRGGLATLAHVGWILALPFLLGGLVGSAFVALEDADVDLATYLREATGHYRAILTGTILVVLVLVVAAFAATTASFVPVAIATVAGLPDGVAAGISWILFLGSTALTVVVLVAGIAATQFFVAASVVEETGGWRSLTRSVEVVRDNLWSVAGFTVLWGAIASAFLAPRYLLPAALVESDIAPVPTTGVGQPLTVLLSTVAIIGIGVGLTYLYTVYTVYYLDLVSPAREASSAQD
mgnify:CR=1 FL=1